MERKYCKQLYIREIVNTVLKLLSFFFQKSNSRKQCGILIADNVTKPVEI